MGLFDFFKKKKPPSSPPSVELRLTDLMVGYFVEYDLRMWEVLSFHQYDYTDESKADEWELREGGDRRYLEVSDDDGLHWTWSWSIPIGKIDGNLRRHIIDNEEPPDRIVFEGQQYYLDDSGAGLYYEGGKQGDGDEMLYWTFLADDNRRFVSIEQWGETDFQSYAGHSVNEEDFTGIFPRSDKGAS